MVRPSGLIFIEGVGAMPNAYEGHIEFFGSPEGYAAAIKKREELGEQLSDPVAAAAFKAANPQYFTAPKPAALPVTAPAAVSAPRQTYQTGVNDILTQIRSKIGKTQDVTKTPYYRSSLDAMKQGANQASQQAMEETNARGILNSTVTADRVGQIQSQAMTQGIPALIEKAYKMQEGELGNLLNILNAYSGLENQEYTRERQTQLDQWSREDTKLKQEQDKLKAAMDRVKGLGYVDNAASVVLGIPVGTPSYEAQKDVQDRQSRLQVAREQIAGSMARTQASNAAAMARTQAGNAASMDRTRYSQGQANQRQQNALTSKAYTEQGMFDPNMYSENAPTEMTGEQEAGATDDVQGLIDQARANGYSEEEIKGFLEEDGLNPADYGL
jgi:hypothetical protein